MRGKFFELVLEAQFVLAGHVALALAAAFAGAAFYVNFAEHPARLRLDDESQLTQWKPSYEAGYIMQGTLAALSGAFALMGWWVTSDTRWIVGAVLMIVNWPYTLWVIMPTNQQLKATAENDAGPGSRALLEKWGRLHAVRTVLGIAATLVFLWALD